MAVRSGDRQCWRSAWHSAVGRQHRDGLSRWRCSDDGGATFRPAYTVSPVGRTANATDTDLDGGGHAFQYGDYTGISFVNGIIQPSWADNSVELSANPDRRFDIANARISRRTRSCASRWPCKA